MKKRDSDLRELADISDRLSDEDLDALENFIKLKRFSDRVSHLRPRHIAIPALMAELLLVLGGFFLPQEWRLAFLGIGSLVIVGLAMTPMFFKRREKSYHWAGKQRE